MALFVFFIIYFLAPGAAERFFGTSIRDSRIAEVTTEAASVISSQMPELDTAQIEALLKDPKVSQFIISAGSASADVVSSVVDYVKNEVVAE